MTTSPALSPAYSFDISVCDAIIAEHYPDCDAALNAWQASEYRTNPARYDEPDTCFEALAQAERFLNARIIEHEIHLNEPEPETWPEEPSSWCERQPADEDELKNALREMVRKSRDEAELRALIAADDRFVGDPAICIEQGYRGARLSLGSTMIMIHAGHSRNMKISHEPWTVRGLSSKR